MGIWINTLQLIPQVLIMYNNNDFIMIDEEFIEKKNLVIKCPVEKTNHWRWIIYWFIRIYLKVILKLALHAKNSEN